MDEKLRNRSRSVICFVRKYKFSVLFLLMVCWGLFGSMQTTNTTFFIRQMMIMTFLTIGVALEYISGDFDLAFVAQISASSLICVFLIQKGVPISISCIVVLIFNGLAGCLKSIMIIQMHMPSVIVTLGLQMILVNLCSGFTKNSNIIIPSLRVEYRQLYLNVAEVLLLIIGVAAAVYFLNQTYYGKYARMLGENLTLARKNGMECTKISMIIHVWASLFFSVPVMFLVLYTGSGSSTLGSDYLYKVFAAVFLGRILFRKQGWFVSGMVMGALAVVVFVGVLTARGYLNQWETIIEGVIILLALWRGEHKKV